MDGDVMDEWRRCFFFDIEAARGLEWPTAAQRSIALYVQLFFEPAHGPASRLVFKIGES